LLDVGCGGGRNTIWWATQGVERLVGVDIAAEMIESARQAAEQVKVGDRCTFETVDFMKTELSATYDIVAACGVFDYVENAVPFLARMGQFANKVIYGSFPGWTLLRTPIRKIRYSLRGCPTHFYRRRELQEIFDAVGFGRTVIKPVPSGFLAWSVRD
jgi:2-polyprenyl-3-methyl-5-hydroxy-6-metoxy-1,4-benzoquinol methylase